MRPDLQDQRTGTIYDIYTHTHTHTSDHKAICGDIDTTGHPLLRIVEWTFIDECRRCIRINDIVSVNRLFGSLITRQRVDIRIMRRNSTTNTSDSIANLNIFGIRGDGDTIGLTE